MKTTHKRRSQPRTLYNVDQLELVPLPGMPNRGQPGTTGDDHANPQVNPLTQTGTARGHGDDHGSGSMAGTCPRPLPSIEGTGSRTAPVPDPTRHRPTPTVKITKDCEPHCLTCHQPDGAGQCQPTCTTTCDHTNQPHKTDICITTTRADAWIVISPNTGYMHLHVRDCPHCHHHHAHAAIDHPWRTAPCGKPYILTIHEPEATS